MKITKDEVITGIIWTVIGACLGAYVSEPFAELTTVGTINEDMLSIEINNTANFKPSGKIRIWGSNGEDVPIGFTESIGARQSRIVNITLNVTYGNVTQYGRIVPLPVGEWYNKKLFYKINCKNCRSTVRDWSEIPDIDILVAACRLRNINGTYEVGCSGPYFNWIPIKFTD